jgi:hypothetical protein
MKSSTVCDITPYLQMVQAALLRAEFSYSSLVSYCITLYIRDSLRGANWLTCKFPPGLYNPVFSRTRFSPLSDCVMVVSCSAYFSTLKLEAIYASETV